MAGRGRALAYLMTGGLVLGGWVLMKAMSPDPNELIKVRLTVKMNVDVFPLYYCFIYSVCLSQIDFACRKPANKTRNYSRH